MRVTVDLSRCVGAGQCAANAPELFTQDSETGLSVATTEEASPDLRAKAEAAVYACPVGAVKIID